MVKHGMGILKEITDYLNPGQVHVMTFDQPLFALAKYVQWSWPHTLGKDKFVTSGLHIEMAIWNTIGDFFAGSGWTSALCEAGVATTETAESFLKASHLTRTRHAHQITALVLTKLRKQAWALSSEDSFDAWREDMAN